MREVVAAGWQTAAVFAEGFSRKRSINFACWTYTGGFNHVQLTWLCDRQLGKLHLANIEQGRGTPSGAANAGVQVMMARIVFDTLNWPSSIIRSGPPPTK